MVPVHCNRTLTEVVTGDRDQTQLDTEKPVRKLAAKRKQSKSSKNRNKRKAKKEAAEYQKSMEELAASTATALIDHSHISRQGYRYEPFIVGSTQPQPASQWQFGQGSFNSQYTADTEPMSQVSGFEAYHPGHPYHSHSTASHCSSPNASIPPGGIFMGAPGRLVPRATTPDPYMIQSHGIYFGSRSNSSPSLPSSETYSGYRGSQLQIPPYPPSYRGSQYCHLPVLQDQTQPMHPPGTCCENGDALSRPCMRYFMFPNYPYHPLIPQYRPTAECAQFVPAMPFNEANGAQTGDNAIRRNGLQESITRAERSSNGGSQNVLNPLDFAQVCQQGPQPCTGPIVRRDVYSSRYHSDEELEPVAVHILETFRSGQYADFRLILNSSAEHCPPVSFPVHSLIASRSPHLKKLMKAMDAATRPREIHLGAAASFSHPFAFGMALQHFYGVPLIAEEQLDNDFTQAVGNTNGEDRDQNCGNGSRFRELEKMRFALCYAASAAFLAENRILRRASRLVTNAICWNNLEVIFHFGISASNFMITPVNSILGTGREAASSDKLHHKATSIPNSSEQDMESDLANVDDPRKYPCTLNWELKEIWGPQLLNEAIDFLIKNFPQNFQLDPDVNSRELPDRLSGQAPSRFSIREISSSVTFGNFAAANNCTSSREERILSAIFLAIPFKILQKLFNAMKVSGILTPGLVEDIIIERERRRIRAARTVKNRNDTSELTVSETDPIGWREEIMSVTGVQEGSPSIIKTWVGFVVPEVIEIKPKEASRGVL
ncbi:uncharacterized protein BDCG_17487 [Blastomyces dermatitidis ER-3]|uniref:BTB domain-containing protein n=1 Tax=Ajellomyces dermatitidis (strain ER-3 / ATCC MYA-2586) TaxID=559297 RepID=A0ABX2VYW9_AJEDR|nr:uncharacterized protein BDCG_17487 [Blastomyces dermatitidis ER-3]OAT02333.1 hypothetical protein BDCG_17487 [Blastomyces dermatitidis ER-3]